MDDEIVKIAKANAKSEDGLMGMEPAIPPKSNHFVLVHGGMHGAWCWYKIMELLEKDGHKVSAIDLKSAGTHPSTADSINSFEEYNQPLMDFLANLPLTEKIVLVGHSMGGASVASASEAFPHLVAVAVYLCALMFRGGERLQQEKEIMNPDEETLQHFEFSFANSAENPPTSVRVRREVQRDLLYGKSSSLDATLASLLIRPLPYMAARNIDLRTTEERYGAVPRVYIKTEHDKSLSPVKQEELIRGSPPKEVYSIDSDHSPFFSDSSLMYSMFLVVFYLRALRFMTVWIFLFTPQPWLYLSFVRSL